MKDYQHFIFDSYDFDQNTGRIALRYSLDDEWKFEEVIEIPVENSKLQIANSNIDQALLALHLAGGTSYYKTYCPKNVEVRSEKLDEKQATFWNTVYENGLGEFFYQNEIDFRGLINFPVTSSESRVANHSNRASTGRTLVPIGGGKDSIVTIETLRKDETKDITLPRMGGHPLIDELVSVTGLPCITIKRTLDPQLFELNKQGALNGHIPITAYLSCLCTVIAEALGFDEIAMSNEKSANIGNVEYLGKEINHQWSKSEEFETAFSKYVQSYINPNLNYHSALREMTELEIVSEFVKYPQYFDCTTSCNKNWKIASPPNPLSVGEGEFPSSRGGGVRGGARWCGTCPKCTFVFALMAAHLKKETVLKMFGSNIFDDESTVPLYKQLLGIEGFKPFECVGTPEETQQAFAMIKERGEFDETPVMQMFISSY